MHFLVFSLIIRSLLFAFCQTFATVPSNFQALHDHCIYLNMCPYLPLFLLELVQYPHHSVVIGKNLVMTKDLPRSPMSLFLLVTSHCNVSSYYNVGNHQKSLRDMLIFRSVCQYLKCFSHLTKGPPRFLKIIPAQYDSFWILYSQYIWRPVYNLWTTEISLFVFCEYVAAVHTGRF